MGIAYKIFKEIHRESNYALEYRVYVNLPRGGSTSIFCNPSLGEKVNRSKFK